MKLKTTLINIVPLIIAGVFLITSCSTNKELACPDFKNNRNYSKKYLVNNKPKRNLHKNYSARRTTRNAFHVNNLQKYRTKDSRDYTINKDKPVNSESIQIESIPNINEFQIPTTKDEKFELVAASDNYASLKESPSVPLSANIKNQDNIPVPVVTKEDLSELTKKEQRQIIKPYKKELRNTLRSYAQSLSGQQAKSAMGFAIASIVCGVIGLFIFGYILGLLAIIFGGIALRRIRMNPDQPGRGLAVAGMVLGLIDVILLAILMLALGSALI
jgi:hypothetical protein